VLILSYGAESPFDWQFKLADFGRSYMRGKAASPGDQGANDSQGIRTYGMHSGSASLSPTLYL
jgi:hypothetical protein